MPRVKLDDREWKSRSVIDKQGPPANQKMQQIITADFHVIGAE